MKKNKESRVNQTLDYDMSCMKVLHNIFKI